MNEHGRCGFVRRFSVGHHPRVARQKDDERKVLARNRRARHDYAIEEVWETGLVLTGSEVKSLRAGHASLAEAFAIVRKDEVWLIACDIPVYPWAHQQNHEPKRERKLLLHRAEIRKLAAHTRSTGYTLVPLELYLKDGRIKLELGLGRGKRHYEKRDAERTREAEREISAATVRRRRAE